MAIATQIDVEVTTRGIVVEALGDIAIEAAARGIDVDIEVQGKDNVQIRYSASGRDVATIVEKIKAFDAEVRMVDGRWRS